MIHKEEIDKIIEEIKKEINTKAIYVFGSYAKGEQTADSDLDVCVITDERMRKKDLIDRIRKRLLFKTDIPLDIIVFHSNEFFAHAQNPYTFEHEIKEKGVFVG